jgi:hypothetical protein
VAGRLPVQPGCPAGAPAEGPAGFGYLFNWHWPSVLYGVDIVAWDIFFGPALLFAAPVWANRVRRE